MSWELWGQILANQAAGWSPQMMGKSKGRPPKVWKYMYSNFPRWMSLGQRSANHFTCCLLAIFGGVPPATNETTSPHPFDGARNEGCINLFLDCGREGNCKKERICVRSTHSVEHIGSTWVAKYDKICLPKTGPARLNNSVKWQGLKQTHPYNKIIIDNYDWHAKTKNPHKLFTSIWWDCGWSFDRHCLLW